MSTHASSLETKLRKRSDRYKSFSEHLEGCEKMLEKEIIGTKGMLGSKMFKESRIKF